MPLSDKETTDNFMKYHFKIHKEEKGYWAECVELKGCQTQAKNHHELSKAMEEALNLYLDEPEDSNIEFSLPNLKLIGKKNIVEVTVNPKIAFSLLLKKARQEQSFSQNQMAKLLGLRSVFGYQKLESSRYANPTLLKIYELKEILPNLRLDLLFS